MIGKYLVVYTLIIGIALSIIQARLMWIDGARITSLIFLISTFAFWILGAYAWSSQSNKPFEM